MKELFFHFSFFLSLPVSNDRLVASQSITRGSRFIGFPIAWSGMSQFGLAVRQ